MIYEPDPGDTMLAKCKAGPAFLGEPLEIIHMHSKHVRALADPQF